MAGLGGVLVGLNGAAPRSIIERRSAGIDARDAVIGGVDRRDGDDATSYDIDVGSDAV
jgi:hypothetical protein